MRRRLLILANLALLAAFPVAWSAPLLRAGLLPWFGLSEISILSGLASLWEADRLLAALVALLALVLPYAKTLSQLAVLTGYLPTRALPLLGLLGHLAMAEVFLIALYIVLAKGAGVGHIETAWGLWLFTGCVLTGLLTSHISKAALVQKA